MTDIPRSSTVSSVAICVFCGAKPGRDPLWTTHAAQVGAAIARHGHRLVYGGGGVGLMGAVAEAALQGGAHVSGIIPRRLLGQEVGKFHIDQLEVVESMAERKTRMLALSDAFLVLAGGLGTLDELFEVLTLRQIGEHQKPVAILNLNGYFSPLRTALQGMVDAGFVRAQDLDHVHWCDSVEDAMAALGPVGAVCA